MSYTPETGITGMTYSSQQNYTYGDTNWKDKLTAVDGNSITYDAIGNPVSYNGYTFEWEQGRQLDRLYGNGVYCDYAYDENGLRVSKFYNGTTYNYTWVDNQLTHQAWNNNYIHFYYDGDSIIGFDYNGTSYTYIKNIQGDVMGIVDNSGILVAEYEYDAWGKLLFETGSMANINPIRYRGYYYDSEIGMYYLQSRYYDPSLRRFINEDIYTDTETGTVLSTNMFAYCENNPISAVDPKGTDAIWLLDKQGAYGFGHVAILLKDGSGWYYASFQTVKGGKPKYQVVQGYLKKYTFSGQKIKLERAYVEYNKKEYYISEYETQYYIYGNFSNSVKQATSYINNNPSYWVTGQNCAWLALYILQKSTRGEIYNNIDKQLWGYKIQSVWRPVNRYFGVNVWTFVKYKRTIVPNTLSIKKIFKIK